MRAEIIAELAQGFEGRPELARLLLKAAAGAGADAAKYQLVYADELATADYEHYQLFKALEMPDHVWEGVAIAATDLRIQLQLDVFGPRSLQLAEQAGAAAIKLHATDLANQGLLAEVARSPIRRVLLGAGGSWRGEIESALDVLAAKQVVVLLGFQGYPTATGTNQIARVRLLTDQLRRTRPGVEVGFADHASPDSPLRYALAAAALGAGATVIEKHLTLGRNMKLEDHESALNPDEFQEFTSTLRGCAEALGTAEESDDWGMADAEANYRARIRRHVVASRDLRGGARLTPDDLTLKRTSSAMALTDPGQAYQKTLRRDLRKDAAILATDLGDGGEA